MGGFFYVHSFTEWIGWNLCWSAAYRRVQPSQATPGTFVGTFVSFNRNWYRQMEQLATCLRWYPPTAKRIVFNFSKKTTESDLELFPIYLECCLDRE